LVDEHDSKTNVVAHELYPPKRPPRERSGARERGCRLSISRAKIAIEIRVSHLVFARVLRRFAYVKVDGGRVHAGGYVRISR
jgi:hypothetical protein